AYPVGEASYDFWPVLSRRRRGAVLGVRLSDGQEGRPPEPEQLVEIVAGYLAVALDREAYAAEAADARVQGEGERLKTDLLAAVTRANLDRPIDQSVASDGRTLLVDPALFETALVNVLENAAKYAPTGSPIRIMAGSDERFGWIEVLDEGPGFTGEVEPLFAK